MTDKNIGQLIEGHKAFIFDLDMTLVETHFFSIYDSIVKNILVLGGQVPDINLAAKFWYGSIDRDQCIVEHFKLKPEVFWPSYRKYDTVEKRLFYTYIIPGARETLLQLQAKGKKIAVITASVIKIAAGEIKMLDVNLDGYFSVTENPLFKEKPDPDSLFQMMNILGVEPHETIFVGDGYQDGVFAHQAGVKFIYFYRHEHVKFDFQPEATFTNWNEFLSL